MNIEDSRQSILNEIAGVPDVTFIRSYGNIGDHLIYAGTRQLLRHVDYREISIVNLQGVSGHTALLSGSGAWCWPFHDMPKYLPLLERRFERVVVLPSSFDTTVPCVREALGRTSATVFARERESFSQIRDLCKSKLAFDCAFYFDFGPYQRQGHGVLNAYRSDRETGGGAMPPDNDDISLTCETMDEWLWRIARSEVVRTDRAHVTIAAAMLGKRVEYRKSSYHKVPAIVDYSLRGYPVTQDPVSSLREAVPEKIAQSEATKGDSDAKEYRSEMSQEASQEWTARILSTAQQIETLTRFNDAMVLVDEDQIRAFLSNERRTIPFLDRDGEYWGPPIDDAHAIRELTWLREQGAQVLIVAWPAFWWLEHYSGWAKHLRRDFRCLVENESIVAFDLSSFVSS